MKRSPIANIVSLLLIFGGAALALSGFLPQRPVAGFDLAAFGRLPVQYGTRVLPIDSVARNTLRLISDRTAVRVHTAGETDTEGQSLAAVPWFLDVIMRPEIAEGVPVFRVTSDDVLGLIGEQQKGAQLFSFRDLSPYFDKIESAFEQAEKNHDAGLSPSLFESEIISLHTNLFLFRQMQLSFVPDGPDPVKEWKAWQDGIKPGTDAMNAQSAGKPFDQTVLDDFALQAMRYKDLQDNAIVGLLPPAAGVEGKWSNLGQGALTAIRAGQLDPVLRHYADAGKAWRDADPQAFNTAVGALQQDLALPQVMPKVRLEAFINSVEPFFRGALLYMFAFICACISWAAWGEPLRRAALWLVVFGISLHLLGLGVRVYLTGYGVVTSLYSSALFIGAVSVIVGLVLERGALILILLFEWVFLILMASLVMQLQQSAMYVYVFMFCQLLFLSRIESILPKFKRRDSIGIGLAVGSAIGFSALVIAHNIPFGGDDLELPQAVLATNLWLWTHVTCITIGYSAMFVAGALGVGYILARAFASGFTAERSRELARLVYGVTCFATLFSFVGTMLGGIWADQSWGRFWGWDPKENGALLIVLWCAICLHARWGKICSERTQMVLAVFGNMVTAWSWFGVNLLGVGLHSYGWVSGILLQLSIFWISQALLIGLAFLPPRFWQDRPAAA